MAYQESYRSVRSDIAKDWHAARVLRKIEGINPEFYPAPFDGFNWQGWNRLQGGHLTRKKFERLYDKFGAMFNSQNPFSKGKISLAFHKKVPEYLGRIETLLSDHLVEIAESRELIHVIVPMEENAPIQARHLVREANHV